MPSPGVSVLVYHNITLQLFKKFLEDETVKSKLKYTKILSEVKANDCDVIFYIGGYGPVIVLAADLANIKLASEVGGQSIFMLLHLQMSRRNKSVKSSQVQAPGHWCDQHMPWQNVTFPVEDRTKDLGRVYQTAAEPWGSKVVTSGNLTTGHLRMSSEKLSPRLSRISKECSQDHVLFIFKGKTSVLLRPTSYRRCASRRRRHPYDTIQLPR